MMKGIVVGNGLTVARLAMIDVTWAYCRFGTREGPEEQVWNRYRILLADLLGLFGDAADLGSSPGAWILHTPQLREVEHAVEQMGITEPIFAPYRWFQKQHWLKGWCEVDDPHTVAHIAKGLECCRMVSTRAWMDHQEVVLAAQMNLFACRLYLTPEQVRTRLDPKIKFSSPIVSAHACIDFRFQERSRRYWLCATLSLWTHKPESHALAPSLSANKARKEFWDLNVLHGSYKTLAATFKERVREQFHLAEMQILDREHRPPQFWLTECPWPLRISKAVNSINDINSAHINTLARLLLGVPDVRSSGVAASIIEERMLVLRRFVVDGDNVGEELPCYLIIPLGKGTVAQEDHAWLLTEKLMKLEAFAAAQLFDIVSNLDMHASHLEVYKAVAFQADVFWDQLALFLPLLQRGTEVHKLVELVHQILLQGIADLDQVAILANRALRDANKATNDLKDKFDRDFTQRPLPGAPSIGSSLTETGYFDDAAREGDRVIKDAEQAQQSYNTLLNGITLAFDERRVRGTDVLEYAGFALALLVVVFSFFPEALNALFAVGVEPLKGTMYTPSAWTPSIWVVILITLGGFVGLLGTGSLLLRRRGRLSILGSDEFRKHYEQLWTFLAECKTDCLTRRREDSWRRVQVTLDDSSMEEAREWNRFITEWDEHDKELARGCAEFLDQLPLNQNSNGLHKQFWKRTRRLEDLSKKVGGQIEQVALKSLLVSERPREFWKFPLPRLTFLYRFYPMMGSELLSSSVEEVEPDIVSDADLRFTISIQCNGSGGREEIKLIERWAKHKIGRPGSSLQSSAVDFVEALNDVGLKTGMTSRNFKAMLERMTRQPPEG